MKLFHSNLLAPQELLHVDVSICRKSPRTFQERLKNWRFHLQKKPKNVSRTFQERLKNVSRTSWEFSGDWALMYWWRRRLKTSGTNYTISFSKTILFLLLLCRDVFLHWTSVSGTENFPDTDLQCRETPPATVREKEWPSFPVLENVVWKPRSQRGRNGIPKQRRCTLDSSYVSFVSH